MQERGLDGRLPVFVFPPSLTFYQADVSTHKQIITLYNPYDFCIGYQVLCNAPVRYTVDSPLGVIRAKCSVDIIVRHVDVSSSNLQTPDKLRIQISEEGKRQVLGRKDVPATLVKGQPEPRSATESDRFESVQSPPDPTSGKAFREAPADPQRKHTFGNTKGNNGPSMVLVAAALLCLLALLMPTEGDTSVTRMPIYLHLNANIKIVIAYMLGLLTYAILRAG